MSSVFETAVAAECRDTEARPIQILSRFTQPHRLCSWSQSEIYQNLDSNSAATLGPRAQVNCTSHHHIKPEVNKAANEMDTKMNKILDIFLFFSRSILFGRTIGNEKCTFRLSTYHCR